MAVADYLADAQIGRGLTPDIIAKALSLAPPDSLDSGHLFAQQGRALSQSADSHEDARFAFDQALLIAQREKDAKLESMTQAYIADWRLHHLELPQALDAGERVVESNRGEGDTRAQIGARYSMTCALLLSGDHEAARRQAATMAPLAESLQAPKWRSSIG